MESPLSVNSLPQAQRLHIDSSILVLIICLPFNITHIFPLLTSPWGARMTVPGDEVDICKLLYSHFACQSTYFQGPIDSRSEGSMQSLLQDIVARSWISEDVRDDWWS